MTVRPVLVASAGACAHEEAVVEAARELLRVSSTPVVAVRGGPPAAVAAAISESAAVLWCACLAEGAAAFTPARVFDAQATGWAAALRIPLLARLHGVPCVAWLSGFAAPGAAGEAALLDALAACRAAYTAGREGGEALRAFGFAGAVVPVPAQLIGFLHAPAEPAADPRRAAVEARREVEDWRRAYEHWKDAAEASRGELDLWRRSKLGRLSAFYWRVRRALGRRVRPLLVRLRGSWRALTAPRPPQPAPAQTGGLPALPRGRYDVVLLAASRWDRGVASTLRLAAEFGRAGHRVLYVAGSGGASDAGAPAARAVNVAELVAPPGQALDGVLAQAAETLAIGDAVVLAEPAVDGAVAARLQHRFGWVALPAPFAPGASPASVDAALREACPLVSVVIVTYGGLALTQECLRSLLGDETWPRFEAIVVDNASSDDTPAFLRGLDDPRVQVVLNDSNRGFAAANNIGIARAQGEVVVLLNNDTVVPPGLLGRLVAHLRRNATLGLLCPTTNFCGNEARVEPDYADMSGLGGYAARRAARHAGHAFDIGVAAMYCVAARRAVLDEVGPLDEAFGVGMFEDDDFSLRMRRAGYRVACAEDAYVHHVGQGSFAKLPAREYDEIWRRNQAYFEQKWGMPWRPHQPRAGVDPAASRIA